MSTSRLFSIVVALALVVVAVLTIRAGIATSQIVSSTNAALDQHERHPGFVNLSSALAEQARLEYRQGEWNAGQNSIAALDQHERHVNLAASTEQARFEYRRGEWNAGSSAGAARYDVEQARIGWRAGMATSEVMSNGQDLLDYFQRHPGATTPTAEADLSDYFLRHPGSAIPADTAASDWFERHAESLKAGNAVDLSDYYQRHPGVSPD